MFSPDEVHSISDFMQLCRKTLSHHIPSCWLRGEVSNLSQPSSGHLYFSLKDDKAQIRCVLFKLTKRHIPFTIENGQSILVHASPTIYEARGDFQIVIDQVETLGTGNLQRAFEQLKKQLNKEGLFAQKYKKPLPANPQTIGIITSKTGAVIKDILHILKRRCPSARVLLFSTSTQGQQCPDEMVNACFWADKAACDVLIVARGGGSLEDLWCFNEEIVARAIFALKTPVVSAIGHQTDTTIADFVADVVVPTPSAAAEIITRDWQQKQVQLNQQEVQLTKSLQKILQQYHNSIAQLKKQLTKPSTYLQNLSLQLDYISTNLENRINTYLIRAKSRLNEHTYQLHKQSPQAQISAQKARYQQLKLQLRVQILHLISTHKNTLSHQAKQHYYRTERYLSEHRQRLKQSIITLNHLNPLHILKRGFSISFDAQKNIIYTSKQIKMKQIVHIRLSEGEITTKVVDKK